MERVESEQSEVFSCVEEAPRSSPKLTRRPSIGYILPFVFFMGILAVDKIVSIPQVLRFVLVFGLLAVFSRGILPARAERLAQSVLLGVAVFFIWVGPDILFPGYRNSFLFSNALVGRPEAATLFSDRGNLWFLSFRLLMSVVTVPIIEELFWRGWMMRWIVNREFRQIPIGSYHPDAFWIVAALFASEHGSYWDVGW